MGRDGQHGYCGRKALNHQIFVGYLQHAERKHLHRAICSAGYRTSTVTKKTRHKRHKDQLPCDTVYTSHNVNEMSTVHTCITFDDMQWSRQWSRNSHDINYEDLKMKEVCVHWILTQCSNTNRVDTFCQVPAIQNQRHWRFLCKISHRL